jgi:predicted RNA-binding Zn ribbon-like protein
MDVAAHRFGASDLVGGHLALDFANTVNGRDGAPVDWLDGYPRLLEWASRTGEFSAGLLARLRARSGREARESARALARARRLREAIFSLFAALAAGRRPPAPALAALERRWREAMRVLRLAGNASGARPVLDERRAGLDAIAFEVALRAVGLLAAPPAGRLRLCAGTDCAWLFVDASRGGRRRWCDMATCGNVAKARAWSRRRRRRGVASTK